MSSVHPLVARLRTPTLSQRLVDHHLMFGLACVFVCLAASLLLAWHGVLMTWTAASVALPLLLLLCGALTLRRQMGVATLIEQQIRQIGELGVSTEVVKPLAAPGPLAYGWNAIVGRLEEQQLATALEAKLRTSFDVIEQQRWTSIFNALPSGVAATDSESCILRANSSLAALLNLSEPRAAANTRLTDLLRAEFPAAASEIDALCGDGAVTRDLQRGPLLDDGVLRVTRTPLGDNAFGAGGLLWIVEDVTQRRLAEAMRNQFVSTATHELRTPLTNIVAYSELLGDEATVDVEQQQKFCNIINSEANRLTRFIDQMLNVSQMESGALSLMRHETDIARLIEDATKAVSPQAAQKSLTFGVNVPPKLPKLRIDKDKVSAALVNLLGNAVKYTPDGGSISLKVEESAEALLFHVDDSGIGIDPAELSKLGTKFFRSSDARVRDIRGSGLGLAFVQEAARLHGGRLNVVSELNKGSRFTFSLPLR